MNDTDKHERIEPGLHPEVVEWVENAVKAWRHYKADPAVIESGERLLEMAKGERQ